jgi:hypothetical protein
LARKAFEPLFVEALSSNLVDVRKAAVEGLVNIDKATALKVLAEKQIYNDPDAAIVKMVIDLAREVGGGKDYIWLTEKVKQGTEGAWAAVIAILQREDVSIVDKAVAGIDSYEIDDAKKIEVFEIGRKKAGIQYKSTILLAHFYLDRSKFTEAADLYAWLLADTAGKSEAVNDAENALKAFAAAGKEDQIVSLVALMLNSGDIQPEGAAAAVLQNAVKSSKSGLKDKLIKITVPEPRPGWQKLAQGWKEPPVSTAKEPASPAKSPAPEQKQPEAKPAAETAAAAKPAQPQS